MCSPCWLCTYPRSGCPSALPKTAWHACNRIRPVSGTLSWKLLLVELLRKLGNVENPQVSHLDCNRARWHWAGHLNSPDLSFLICEVGAHHLPHLLVGHSCETSRLFLKPRSCSIANVSSSSFLETYRQIENDQLTTGDCIAPRLSP